MPYEWRPTPGQLALLEPADAEPGQDCLTGVVIDSAERVVIDLGASPRPSTVRLPVTASFFTPQALYRLDATASAVPDAPGVLELEIHDVERVQRRTSLRTRIGLPVALAAFDGPGPFTAVVGETIDVAAGGCRVATPTPFPPGVDPTVSIRMPDGSPVIALARVVGANVGAGRCEYRLVFADIASDDADRLLRLTAAPA